jgi:hypothetical protein
VHVAPTASSEWTAAAAFQKEVLEEALARSKDLLPRFAVFSLAPIPLAIHLGYVLSDRVEVRLFQYDRDRSTWRWQEGQRGDADFIVQGIPETPTEEPLDVVVRVSLSATIARADTREVVPGDAVEVDIRVGAPDVTWLRDAEQLVEFGQVFRGVLGDIARAVPNARTVHLFYAGPTGGAITIGRAINPRMVPPAQTYQYDRRSEPRYRPAILLK